MFAELNPRGVIECILDLTDALLGPSPHEPQILEAAREAAEMITDVDRVQRWRRASIEGRGIAQVAASDAIRADAGKFSRALKVADAEECRRLRDEFRATHDAKWVMSLELLAESVLGRKKALRRLDYERVEAQHRQVAARRASTPRRWVWPPY